MRFLTPNLRDTVMIYFYRKHSLLKAGLLGLLAFAPLGGCDLANNHLKIDRSGNMEFQDYRDAMAPRMPDIEEAAKADQAGIPSFQDYVADPSDKLQAMPLVSISINQNVPLRDALFELAEQAGYDMELDPRIRGSIIFTARNKPFDVVIDRISNIAGLRYTFEDDILRVEMDTPYHEIYKLNYLSYIRTNAGSISNNVAVVSGDGADTGSRFSATTESEINFWGELEANLTQILGAAAASNLTTNSNPQITAVNNNPAPVEPLVITEDGEIIETANNPQPAILQVQSLPTDSGAEEEEQVFNTQFSINKQAGIISVYGSERDHKKVAQYLDMLRESVTSQVLIEAKVLEVSLNDEFAAGIDWGTLAGFSSEFTVGFGATGGAGLGGIRPVLDPAVAQPATSAILSYSGNDLTAAVDAISRFGTVHALASPRLTVLNNQSAVLNVATNRVYFEVDVTTTTVEGSPPEINLDTEIRNVPEGVLINVQPSIDNDSKEVAMAVRPTITRIVDQVPDPAAEFQGVTSNIPEVNVQEVDTVVKVGSGQTVIIGGLMQDRSESTQKAVPVLGELPVIGGAFRNQGDKVSKTELVVFLKATIVKDAGTIHQTDKDLYKTFSQDRRPINF